MTYDLFFCYHNIIMSIPLLLRARSPSAIIRFVIAIIVLTINTMFRCRLFTHILEKVFKFEPALTYSYSTATIATPTISFRISRSLNHPCPRNVFRRFCHTVGCREINFQTTTAFYLTVAKTCPVHNVFASAITKTIPPSIIKSIVWSATDNGETAELSAYHGYCDHDTNLLKLG